MILTLFSHHQYSKLWNNHEWQLASWGSCAFNELSSSSNGKKIGKKLQYYKAIGERWLWWQPLLVKLLIAFAGGWDKGDLPLSSIGSWCWIYSQKVYPVLQPLQLLSFWGMMLHLCQQPASSRHDMPNRVSAWWGQLLAYRSSMRTHKIPPEQQHHRPCSFRAFGCWVTRASPHLFIWRWLFVRPTSKYVPKWWDKSPNKQQFLPKLQCTLSHNRTQDILQLIGIQ